MSDDNVNRDLGAGEGGAVSVVEEEEEDGDEDKLKDDLNRSQSPSAMSQSSNYLEWDPSADVGALSTMPGSSSSGGRGRADELYLGEHFDTPESPEIKVLYGPKNLLRSNPSSSNQLYCYSTPQSSRTSRVTFSSFDCSPIDIQSPPEYHESTPSTEVSAKESHVKTTAYTRPAAGRPQVIRESDSEATDSSPTYQSVAGTVGSSSVQKESDIGIDSQSPPELKESDGAVEKKSGATVTYSSTDYKSVGAAVSVSFKEGSDAQVTVSSTAYKSVAPQKSSLKKTSKAKAELDYSEARSLDTARYFGDESNNNNTVEEGNEQELEEEDLTLEESSRRTPPGVVVSDASTDWEYDHEKKAGGSGGGYRPDWRTHGITRSEIEYAERKKSGSSSSAASSVFILQVEAQAKSQCGTGRGRGTSSADEGGDHEGLPPPPPPPTQKKSKSRSSTDLRSRGTASASAQVSSSSASGPVSDESELERRLNDIRNRCPAVSSANSRRHRSPNDSDPSSLTLSSNAGCSSTSSSSLGVDPETLLKILESNPSTESVKYDALKIHRDYHLAQVWKQIAKLAELNRALLTHKASKEDGAQGSRSVQKVSKACGPSEPSSMISGFEDRKGPPRRYTNDPFDYMRKRVTNEDLNARAKQELERNPKKAEYVSKKSDMGPPPPPKQRGAPPKKKSIVVPPPPPVKVFLAPQKNAMQSTSTAASGGDSETDDTGPLKKAIKNYLKKHNMELYKSIKADVSGTSSSAYSRLEQSSMKESVGLPSDGYLSDSFVYLRGREKAHGSGVPLKMATERNQMNKVEELRAKLRKAIEKQNKQQPQVAQKEKKKPSVGFYIGLGEEKGEEGGERSKGPKKTIEEYLKEYNPQCYKNIKERDDILIQVKRDREANHVQMDYFIEQAAAYQREGAAKERVAGYRGVGNCWGDGKRDDLKEFWEKYMLTAQKKADDENKENENVMNMRKSPDSPHVISTREMKARTARLRTNDPVAYARRRKELDERRRKATRLLQKQFSENLREFRKVVGDVNVPDRLKLGPRPR